MYIFSSVDVGFTMWTMHSKFIT